MKNCISRRSFLKAAGILGAAGALAACGGSSASTSTAASTAGCYRCKRSRFCHQHQAVDIPHRRLGQRRHRPEPDLQLQRQVPRHQGHCGVPGLHQRRRSGEHRHRGRQRTGPGHGRPRASGCKLGRQGRDGSAERPVDRRCQEGHLRVR